MVEEVNLELPELAQQQGSQVTYVNRLKAKAKTLRLQSPKAKPQVQNAFKKNSKT